MLIAGEKIEQVRSDEQGAAKTDAEITAKYISGEIRIITEQARYSLESIPTLKAMKLDTEPEYQRRGRWDSGKKSRLIESFIMNIPVPPVFLYEFKLAHYEVMDGKQRITAIRDFYNNIFALEGLEYWKELEGRTYSNLPETIRSAIDRRSLSGIVLLYETAQSDPQRSMKLKKLVFERINSGGVELTHQESRNALYNGHMNELCLKLSQDEHFVQLWGISSGNQDTGEEPSEIYKNMTDVELVLRFFAIRQRAEFVGVYTYLSEYLDFYLKQANEFPAPLLNSLEELFIKTMGLIHSVLGEKAFCPYRRNSDGSTIQIGKPSYLMYEPICYVFSKHIGRADEILEKGEIVRTSLVGSIADKSEKFKGRLSNPNYIFERIGILEEALVSALER